MRRLLFSISIVFLFAGCEIKYYSVLITNDSSKDVSYTFNDSSDKLASKTSKTYEVVAYTPPPKDIIDKNGIASMELKKDPMTSNFTIFDNETSFNLNVVNNLPVEIKIKAGNYIDDSDSPVFIIDANKVKTTAKIYTSKPKFTSLSDYPVIIDWNFKVDTVYVVIR